VAKLFEVDRYDKDHAFMLDNTTHIYFVLDGTVGIYDPCQAPSLNKKEKPKSRYSTKNENVRVVVFPPPTAALADARAGDGKSLLHACTLMWGDGEDRAVAHRVGLLHVGGFRRHAIAVSLHLTARHTARGLVGGDGK
jgi:hypothetical protein